MENKKRDKHGYTIGIKHYLNKKLKGIHNSKNHETNEVEYPLYVQITVKQQTIRVKSALHIFTTSDNFDRIYQDRIHDIENERSIIRRYILSQKPFDNSSFKLEWSWLDASDKYTLNGIVSDYLIGLTFNTIQDKFMKHMVRSERFWKRAETDALPCRLLTEDEYKEALRKYRSESGNGHDELSLLHKLGVASYSTTVANFYSMFFSLTVPEVKEIRDEFPPEFWDLSNYIDKMSDVHKIQFFTIDDLLNGRFNDLFMSTWNNEESLKAIRRGFDHLRTVYPYFDRLFQECFVYQEA